MIQSILIEISQKRRIHLYPSLARDESFAALARPARTGSGGYPLAPAGLRASRNCDVCKGPFSSTYCHGFVKNRKPAPGSHVFAVNTRARIESFTKA
jgi:hypothetical protein